MKRDSRIELRLPSPEKRRIQRAAKQCGVSVSTWLLVVARNSVEALAAGREPDGIEAQRLP